MTEERLATLMVKAADGLTMPSEKEELERHIRNNPELAEELDMHTAIKAVSDTWMARLEADLAEDRYRKEGLTAMWVNAGLTLLLLGVITLASGAVVTLLFEPEVPMWVKGATVAISAGTLMLMAAAARWKLMTASTDKYTEINR